MTIRGLISARQVVQDALEAHYGTWRADGDPEWAEVANVVIDGLHAANRVVVRQTWLERLQRLTGPR